MRAKMSQRDRLSIGPNLLVGQIDPRTIAQRIADQSSAALAEARAILAETEPSGIVQTIGGPMLTFVGLHVPVSYLAQEDRAEASGGNGTRLHARIARDLRDSLRSFVEA